MNKKNFISKYFISGFIFILFSANIAFSQLIIKGKITDLETKKPIVNAEIQLIQWNKGDRTNEHGEYDIKLPLEKLEEGDLIQIQFSAKNYSADFEHFYYKNNPTIIDVALKKKESQIFSTKVTKIYNIRYRDPREIENVIRPFLTSRAKLTVSANFKTITLKDIPEIHKKVAELVQKYDTPLKNIWLEVTIIKATRDGRGSEKFPPKLSKTINKIHKIFNFDSYEEVGNVNGMGIEETLLRLQSSKTNLYLGGLRVSTRLSYSEGTVKLKDLSISSGRQGNFLETTANIGDGETIILGASQSGKLEESLITIVTAKVVE